MNENIMKDHLAVTVEGEFVSQKWAHLAEMLTIYNPGLTLKHIPRSNREFGDGPPYVVTAFDKNGSEYAVLYARDQDAPEEVLARVLQADMKHGNVMDRMNARNVAYKAFEMAKKEDDAAAKRDMTEWLAKSDKNWRQFVNHKGEKVKIDDRGKQTQIRSHM